MNPAIERLRYHVSGAIERGEAQAIAGIPAPVSAADYAVTDGLHLAEIDGELLTICRASAARARRLLASTRKAATFQRQRADVLAAQLDKLRADMADPSQPERAIDLAQLVRERDQARTALAATDARNRAMKAALDDLADKFEAMASRLAVAEAAMRRAPIAV